MLHEVRVECLVFYHASYYLHTCDLSNIFLSQISMSAHLKHTTAILTPSAPIQRDRFIALVKMDILVAVSRV